MAGLKVLASLADLIDLVTRTPDVYVRYSEGWGAYARHGSSDTESGLKLPGFSINPWRQTLVDPPAGGPACTPALPVQEADGEEPRHLAWVAGGVETGRGPDCEPLLAEVRPVALLPANLLTEAEGHSRWNFDAGKGPEDP